MLQRTRINARQSRRAPDFIKHPLRPGFDLDVGETKDAEALRRQRSVPEPVLGQVVERAIGLDDQPMTQRSEVHDEGSSRHLTPDLQAVEPTIAEQNPKPALVERSLPAENLGEIAFRSFHASRLGVPVMFASVGNI